MAVHLRKMISPNSWPKKSLPSSSCSTSSRWNNSSSGSGMKNSFDNCTKPRSNSRCFNSKLSNEIISCNDTSMSRASFKSGKTILFISITTGNTLNNSKSSSGSNNSSNNNNINSNINRLPMATRNSTRSKMLLARTRMCPA